MHEQNLKKSGTRISSIVAYGLFLLFPGFYFYNILLATGKISIIPGGYFAAISVCLLAVFLLWIGKTFLYGKRASVFFVIFAGLILWCSLLAILSVLTGNEPHTQQAFVQVAETIALWIVFFHLGLYVNLDQSSIRLLFWISGFMILANLIYYVLTTGSLFFYVKEFYNASDEVAVYQGFSRSALITAFICLATIKLKGVRLLLLLAASFFCLFLLGSRSELIAFVFITSIVFIVEGFKNPLKVVFPILGLVLLSITIIFSHEGFSNSRQMELFDLERSSSWQARSDLSSQAFDRIKKHPVIGEIGGHFESGGEGGYAHNILSAWDAFGLIGFVLYFLLVLVSAASALLLIATKKSLTSNEKFFVFMAVSSFLLSLAAKSVYSPLPAIAWGLYMNCRNSRHLR